MQKLPRIIVCGLVRNAACQLQETLEAINRFRWNAECSYCLIVTNDNSDATPEILREWRETPRPLLNEPVSYTAELPIAELRPGIYEAHHEGAHLYDTSRNTKIGLLIRWEASYSADANASDPSPVPIALTPGSKGHAFFSILLDPH